MIQKYWVLIALWIFYFVIHSLAAATFVKKYFEHKGVSRSDYRKGYVIGSTLGLIVIMIYGATLPETQLIETGAFIRYISLALAASGTIVIRSAFKQYNIREFLGLKEENSEGQIEEKGILSYVRHPLYSGTILIVVGYFMYVPRVSSLIIALIVFLYLAIGIYLEEKKLEAEFGERYTNYKKRVPALVPKLKAIISF